MLGSRIVGRLRTTLRAHPVAAVLLLAAAVRLATLRSVPLVITNDGLRYVEWARALAAGGTPELPPYRTPGYPLFLAGLFRRGGIGPTPMLVAQHALGALAAGLVAATLLRLRGGGSALLWGALVALDPVLLGFESYALTESLSAFLLLAVCAVLMRAGPIPARAALAGGVLLAAACLVHPAFQVLLPFALVAVAVRPRGETPRLSARAVAALLLGFAVTVAPWLLPNLARGTPGLSSGNVGRWS